MTEISLAFSREGQQEAALRHAAYRLTGIAVCQIDMQEGHWVCRLTPSERDPMTPDALRERFLMVLNDENLREQIEERTSKLRDVIVALAFGALVPNPPSAE